MKRSNLLAGLTGDHGRSAHRPDEPASSLDTGSSFDNRVTAAMGAAWRCA